MHSALLSFKNKLSVFGWHWHLSTCPAGHLVTLNPPCPHTWSLCPDICSFRFVACRFFRHLLCAWVACLSDCLAYRTLQWPTSHHWHRTLSQTQALKHIHGHAPTQIDTAARALKCFGFSGQGSKGCPSPSRLRFNGSRFTYRPAIWSFMKQPMQQPT